MGRILSPTDTGIGPTGAVGPTGPAGSAGAVGPTGPLAVGDATIRLSTFALKATVTSQVSQYPIGSVWWCTSARSVIGRRFVWKRAAGGTETVRIRVWIEGVAQVIGAAGATYVDVSASSDGLQPDVIFTVPVPVAAGQQFTMSAVRTDGNTYVSWAAGTCTIGLPTGLDTGFACGPYLFCADSGRFGNAGGDIEPTSAWNNGAGNDTGEPLLDVS